MPARNESHVLEEDHNHENKNPPHIATLGLVASFGCSDAAETDGSLTDSNSTDGNPSYGAGGFGDTATGGNGGPTGGNANGVGGDPLIASGGTTGTPTANCPGITAAGYDLCESGSDYCEAVFTDGSGCTAVCAAAGLDCLTAYENVDNACAGDMGLAALACDSGHQSDFCVCGGEPLATGGAPGVGGSGGMGTGGGSNATVCEAMGWATRDGRTGGQVAVTGGGTAAPVTVTSFSELQGLAGDDTPRVIYISGTVGGGWSGNSGDRLSVGSNKTIVGLAPGTELRAPISISDSQNIIIRNLVIQGPGSSSEQAWDNLNIQGSSKNIWIACCWGSAGSLPWRWRTEAELVQP